MAAPLAWTVDDADGLAVVAVHGRLDLASAPRLRCVLLKCLAEQPEALLVDLAGMELGAQTCLSVFTAVSRQAAAWPGTPVLLCAPRPEVAARLARGRHGPLAVHGSLEQGRRAVAEGRVTKPMIADQLLPVSGAVRHARNLATEACATWGLPGLVGPASLVVSELVSNAIQHAGTLMTVQLSRLSRYVAVAVRDGSAERPRLDESDGGGRGLILVNSLAVHWGSLPSRDGKVVWATLLAV
jgi:anti-anti-sigma regulatory factor